MSSHNEAYWIKLIYQLFSNLHLDPVGFLRFPETGHVQIEIL